MVVAGAVVAGVVSWAVAPLVAFGRRGTIDQRTVATMRRLRGCPPAWPAVELPAPRRSVEGSGVLA